MIIDIVRQNKIQLFNDCYTVTRVRPQNRNATKQEQTGSMNYCGRGYCGVVCWANLSEDYVRQPATASVKSLT